MTSQNWIGIRELILLYFQFKNSLLYFNNLRHFYDALESFQLRFWI